MKTFKPISTSRIEVVDAIRGFALLGVLFANIPVDYDPQVAGAFHDQLGFLADVFISKKFIAIFSMLFGFGFYIQMSRAESRDVNFNSYFIKRMFLLFLIGAIHCFILWNGDIIMSYAFGGVFLLLLRKLSIKKLVVIAILFNVVLTGFLFVANSALGWQIYDYDYALANEIIITNTYARYFEINWIIAPWINFFKDMPITLTFTFGNMLIGFILGKLNFFKLPASTRKLTNRFIILGFTLGITASYFFHLIMTGHIELDIPLLWVPFVLAAGMLLQSLAYMSLFAKLYTNKNIKRILDGFKYVGKTALTNYIFQSVFYIIVFFHFSNLFKLFGEISHAETYVIVLLFFVFQSGSSYLWLKRFNQGPIEYVWKKLSYKKSNNL